MSNATIIRNVGNTLKKLLEGSWEGIPPVVKLDSPKRVQNIDKIISIFLYQIIKHPHLNNEEPQNGEDVSQQEPASLALELMFLVTPFGSDNEDELSMLGRVMQIFYDNPVLPVDQTDDLIKDKDVKIKLTLEPMSFDDQTKIWSAFQDVGYKTSMSYKVTPVWIDSKRNISVQRVASKEANKRIKDPK